MNTPYRSYSDHEIANFVLGVELSASTNQAIQHNLAKDDAAAARALKWEAYFLSIVDGLATSKPPEEILNKIQTTLNIKANDLNANSENEPKDISLEAGNIDLKPSDKSRFLGKKSLFKAGISILLLILIGFISWASLKAPAEKTLTHETINLQDK